MVADCLGLQASTVQKLSQIGSMRQQLPASHSSQQTRPGRGRAVHRPGTSRPDLARTLRRSNSVQARAPYRWRTTRLGRHRRGA